jgi:Fe2+ or Zn2+ uptake regulation protein
MMDREHTAGEEVTNWSGAVLNIISRSDEPPTVEQIAELFGERHPDEKTVHVDDVVSFLVTKGLVVEASDRQHFVISPTAL